MSILIKLMKMVLSIIGFPYYCYKVYKWVRHIDEIINNEFTNVKNEITNVKNEIKSMKYELKNIAVLKKLRNKIIEINNEIELGSSSWENNRRELRRAILEDDLSDFTNWHVIHYTMFNEACEIEYEEVMQNPILSTSIIPESKIGNPKPYYLNLDTSGNLVHQAYNVSQLFKKCELQDFNQIIEFGGGYGSMCRLFRNMNYLEQYIIFDLPEFSALQNFYLDSINSNFTTNTLFTGDISQLNNTNLNLKTLFIATWSLSEMPISLREEVLNNLTFDYCLIAFQSEFDGINNIDYFNQFISKYQNIDFDIKPIKHLPGNFYLIGIQKIEV